MAACRVIFWWHRVPECQCGVCYFYFLITMLSFLWRLIFIDDWITGWIACRSLLLLFHLGCQFRLKAKVQLQILWWEEQRLVLIARFVLQLCFLLYLHEMVSKLQLWRCLCWFWVYDIVLQFSVLVGYQIKSQILTEFAIMKLRTKRLINCDFAGWWKFEWYWAIEFVDYSEFYLVYIFKCTRVEFPIKFLICL